MTNEPVAVNSTNVGGIGLPDAGPPVPVNPPIAVTPGQHIMIGPVVDNGCRIGKPFVTTLVWNNNLLPGGVRNPNITANQVNSPAISSYFGGGDGFILNTSNHQIYLLSTYIRLNNNNAPFDAGVIVYLGKDNASPGIRIPFITTKTEFITDSLFSPVSLTVPVYKNVFVVRGLPFDSLYVETYYDGPQTTPFNAFAGVPVEIQIQTLKNSANFILEV